MIAKSELWRFDWCFRTCVSVSCATFLFLFPLSSAPLKHSTNAAFTIFVTVLAKDVTFGATIVNAWGCILGAFLASIISLILLAIIQSSDPDNNINDNDLSFVLAGMLFTSVILMQYIEIPLMGKKLGVSLLAIHILSFRNRKSDYIWDFFKAVLIGSCCSIVGNIFPPPIRAAGLEVKERLSYSSNVLSSLLDSVVKAWIFEPIQMQQWGLEHANISVKQAENGFQETRPIKRKSLKKLGLAPPAIEDSVTPSASKRWKTLRLLINSAIAFKKSHKYRLSWKYKSRHVATKDRYIRKEMVAFLESEITILLQRSVEARFGPSRSLAIHIFGRYITVMRTILAIISLLEDFVIQAETRTDHIFVFKTFFSCPNFRGALHRLLQAICIAIQKQSLILTSGTVANHVMTAEVKESLLAISNLITAQEDLDAAYLSTRKLIYYSNHDDGRHGEEVPIFTDVLYNMNSVLFLLDTVCNQLITFWDKRELEAFENSMSSPSSDDWKVSDLSDKLFGFLKGIAMDLLPSQSHLCCCSLPADADAAAAHNHNHKLECSVSIAIQSRLLVSFKVALSMMLAALFGQFAQRPQVFLAAFTIAYLAGGAVSGVNVMTSINRAAGTAVAGVYAIIVVFVYNKVLPSSPEAARFVVALAIVLFQVPCTYIRSFPVYSYSGTVAGFTAALLLIDPNMLTPYNAVHRIIDTFIGVGIYLLVELSLFAQRSEAVLLRSMEDFVLRTDQKFANFHASFRLFRDPAATVAANGTDSSSRHVSEREVNTEGTEGAEETEETEGKEGTDGMDLEQGGNSARERSASNSANASAQSRFELEIMNSIVENQLNLLSFYKSEPTVFSPPTLPDRLLQQGIYWQRRAMLNLQVMYWVIASCNSADEKDQRRAIRHLCRKMHSLQGQRGAPSHLVPHCASPASSSSSSSSPSPCDAASFVSVSVSALRDAAAADSSYRESSLLLPLEQQYCKVEKFVSNALAFLRLSIRHLQCDERRLETLETAAAAGERDDGEEDADALLAAEKGPLAYLRSLNRMRLSKLSAEIREETINSSGKVSRDSLYFGEVEGVEIGQLFTAYEGIVRTLREAAVEGRDAVKSSTIDVSMDNKEEVGGDGRGREGDTDIDTAVTDIDRGGDSRGRDSGGYRGRNGSRVVPNMEMKIINTLLCSTHELILSLRSMAVVISRLQAHRDIHISQNSRKFD